MRRQRHSRVVKSLSAHPGGTPGWPHGRRPVAAAGPCRAAQHTSGDEAPAWLAVGRKNRTSVRKHGMHAARMVALMPLRMCAGASAAATAADQGLELTEENVEDVLDEVCRKPPAPPPPVFPAWRPPSA